MSSPLPSVALARWLLQRAKTNRRGFTLAELLVAIAVGSVIVTSMLYLVVELLGTNVREERLTQAQQDTRRALDYISRDAREAVFVYADPATVADQLTDAPADSIPVLAFWRLKPIDIGAIAGCNTDACATLRVRQNVYDLVVYFHRPNNPGDLWSGPGRIIRYELTNYSNFAAQTPTDGYRDPSLTRDGFASWTREGDTTTGSKPVLADFIDVHDDTLGDVVCPTAFLPTTTAESNSFFVCVRDTGAGANPLNQSMSVFLRGSTVEPGTGTAVIFGPTSRNSSLPTISTEVLVRGRIERQL
ncbi:prepilin-type N-terminal cleavage/methylation domain-containing protein [Leptolyngbya sp. CCNP1308]|uniref:PilW family protein n=1 Tax=Leptolyngbya sp. CCNP1308 TaxID=3110255 RepID=UPI002B201DCF|nr:prepilin-type N-terminal cleavage/methylation domain-containing protein [Leptolyngbya sp. CCNP1308]MEA5451359.1 prepilin-type N-terminal cleavage/methylation domain-containing protein [Leptolyngbya sp. CCNP1308]